MSTFIFALFLALLARAAMSMDEVASSYEENLLMWYGPAVSMYAAEYGLLVPQFSQSDVHAYVRSVKVAAFFDAVQELDRRITVLLENEVSAEYAQQWRVEAVGHILGSVDKITALQNSADNQFVQSICETGFNVGYSAINFLIANPRADFISFDIFMNRFGPYAVRALQSMFPSRSITVISGDSTVTVPTFLKRGPLACDLVFVDGGTSEDRNKDIGNFRATANLKPTTALYTAPLNISYHQQSGHMQHVEVQLSGSKEADSPSSTVPYYGRFKTILIVDDMDPITDGVPSYLRKYYEEHVQDGFVRTLDEFHLRYTPCVQFYLNTTHPHGQYLFDTADSDYCKQSWTSAVDGSIRRPDWRAGYFVMSEYV
jgi:hypothetical protein